MSVVFQFLPSWPRSILLCNPVQAPSERIFSVASRLLSAKRTAMDPEFAGKVFFVSENWDWFEDQVNLALGVD